MKLRRVSERGQALVLVALAIIGLVGITGLAIDGSIILADRRHAQNAADTSALAGALAKVKPQKDADGNVVPWKLVAQERAESNGYTNNLVTSTVEVYSCTEAGASCPAPYDSEDPEDYIQVIITSHVDTFFARALGIETLTNKVQALALSHEDGSGPLGNGGSIVSYAIDCESPDNFVVEGNTQVTVTGGGGLFVNTDNPACGFKCETEGASIKSDITTAGGTIDLKNSCLSNFKDDKAQDGHQIDFPIYVEDLGLDVPPECDSPVGSYTNYAAGAALPGTVADYDFPGKGTEKVTVLHPGKYNQFPPPKDSPALKLNDTMLMEPGTYCVSDVIRWNQDKFVLIGQDVTIFIRAGYDFSFSDGVVDIDAPDDGEYAGYLIIVEPDYGDPEFSNNPDGCYINGDANNDFTGSIFAPYCTCTINGSGDTYAFNAQLLCYTVDIKGGGIVNFVYDQGDLGWINDPPTTGMPR